MTRPPPENFGTDHLRWWEVADAVWLAGKLPRAGAERSGEPPPPTPPEPPGPPIDHEPDFETQLDGPSGFHPADAVRPDPSPPRYTGLRPRPLGGGGGGSHWPPESGLPQELAIARAMRPLMRTVPSKLDSVLDEEKTAVRAAEEGLWLPASEPAQVHPFDLLLVVDTSSSMRIWAHVAREFQTMLERQGAFRDVRPVGLDSDQPGPELVFHGSDPGSNTIPPGSLFDPTGQRAVLVLTDGCGVAWRNGTIHRLLARWVRRSPVALADVLPPSMWHWSGLRTTRAKLRTAGPVSAGAAVRCRLIGTESGDFATRESVLPVLALSARWFSRWAELLTGTRPEGVELPVVRVAEHEEDTEDPEPAPGERFSPQLHVRQFRTIATPTAFRLAGLLAAAPLTMHMIRAIQRALLPESNSAHLSEIILGGLIHRTSVTRSAPSGAVIEYEFTKDLRKELLATSTRADTALVLRLAGQVLGPKVAAFRDIDKVLTEPDKTPVPLLSKDNLTFVQVQQAALRALSGPYGRRASRLKHSIGEFSAAIAEKQVPGGDWTGDATTVAPAPSRVLAVTETIQPARGNGNPDVTATSSEKADMTGQRRTGGQPTVWGGIPLRNVNFIGRDEVLEKLRDRLSTTGTTAVLPEALHGLGGIGKSQIAVEYVYRHATDYDLVWWIPAENPSEIRNSLVKLAKRLNLSVEPSVDVAVPAVLEALRIGDPCARWLLVFDNADRPEEVRQFFPVGQGHVLVTSRNAQWAGVANAVELDVFKRSESRELLQRRNEGLNDHDADQLAEVLGDLPLAVEQAAAWRAETGMSAEEYLRLWDDKRAELLESQPSAENEVAVQAAWNVSLDRLARDNPGALELLRVCAFFAPEPIPRNLFTGVRNLPLAPELEATLKSEIRLSRAIRDINRYSLARIDHRNASIQLHRLVQSALRNQLNADDAEQVRHSAHVLLANGDPTQPESSESWARYAELLPHARACLAMDCSDDWVRQLAINLVVAQFSWGDPHSARRGAEEMVEYWTRKLGEDHPDTLVASRWRGRSLRAVGLFAEAREVGQRTLDLLRNTLGEKHEETLLTMHAVASDLRAKGDFYGARDLNKLAYERAKEEFGDDDPDTLAAANNYALSLRLSGAFAAAQRLDEETWRRKASVLGEAHRHTLLTLDNLSVDLREAGEYVEACRVQENTVRQLRDNLGDRHPMTLGAIKNLAVAKRKAGRHVEALKYAQEALEGLRGRYGKEHPEAMSAAMNLSIDLRQTEDLRGARREGMHASELYERVWGEDHPFSLAGATNLAVTLRMLGELDAARRLNERALGRMRSLLGEDHPFTLVCATNLGSDLAAHGDHAAAHELSSDTLERSTRTLGENHPSTLAVALNSSLDLRALGRAEEADELKARTVTRFHQTLGSDHPATGNAVLNERASCDIDPMQI
ncbi:FxSxx-COOH system tetratricopeptide repeat protein [Amycolatopsis magusensis]|uniref:FxSxx-COOH system tetratricopeptide repeat protein n=1 Tax=Amycolatopsis magusensis TaxID=882444 RepID=UPI0037A7FCAF